jgi:hypothetical protein
MPAADQCHAQRQFLAVARCTGSQLLQQAERHIGWFTASRKADRAAACSPARRRYSTAFAALPLRL